MYPNTFTKEERLKSHSVITTLFQKGQSFGQYPLRLVYMPIVGNSSPVQVALSVPKKRYKRAVVRNRIRRRMREAYRLNKFRLYRSLDNQNKSYALMIIYVGKEEVAYAEIESQMKRMMHRFLKKVNPKP